MVQRIKGVMPIIEYDDGGWIGRVISNAGWRNTILTMGKKSTGHWSENPLEEDFQIQFAPENSSDPWLKNAYFVYVEPSGQTTGTIMTNEHIGVPLNERQEYFKKTIGQQPLQIQDAGGIGLGEVTGTARRRLIGFVFDRLLPESREPLGSWAAEKIKSPTTLDDDYFKRKLTAKKTRLNSLLENDPDIQLPKAAKSFIKAKNLKPWGQQTNRLKGPQNISPHTLIFSTYDTYRDISFVLSLHLEPTDSPRWTFHLSKGSKPVDAPPLEQLGSSDIGPFETLVNAGIYVSKSGLFPWLEKNADLGGTERPELDPEPYLLLDQLDPLLWDNSRFAEFARVWGFV